METQETLANDLAGHTSPETALVVDDYPYGFRLRCKIRYWIEYRQGHGFRLGTQTTNPKRAGEPWNKPKYGTYAPLLVLTREAGTGHIHTASLKGNGWDTPEEVDAFERFNGYKLDENGKRALNVLRKQAKREQQRKAGLLVACHATGLVYCDRNQQANRDYKRIAFLPFSTLELQVDEPGSPLLPLVLADAAELQARRGQEYQISTAGQTVILGGGA